jgi:hypothetical protein
MSETFQRRPRLDRGGNRALDVLGVVDDDVPDGGREQSRAPGLEAVPGPAGGQEVPQPLRVTLDLGGKAWGCVALLADLRRVFSRKAAPPGAGGRLCGRGELPDGQGLRIASFVRRRAQAFFGGAVSHSY